MQCLSVEREKVEHYLPGWLLVLIWPTLASILFINDSRIDKSCWLHWSRLNSQAWWLAYNSNYLLEVIIFYWYHLTREGGALFCQYHHLLLNKWFINRSSLRIHQWYKIEWILLEMLFIIGRCIIWRLSNFLIRIKKKILIWVVKWDLRDFSCFKSYYFCTIELNSFFIEQFNFLLLYFLIR